MNKLAAVHIATFCLCTCLLALPTYSQGNPVAERVQQRLNESKAYFQRGDYSMGASRANEAASILKSSPAALPGSTPEVILSDAVNSLAEQAAQMKAKGNSFSYIKAVLAQQSPLRSLARWEPQNPRWHYMLGMTYVTQAGGSTINAAGDRASLQMAIREFDLALASGGGGTYASSCSEMKKNCLSEIGKRQAKGTEIRARAYREMAKYRGPAPNVEQSSQFCGLCRHYHTAGNCTYRAD